MKYTDAKVGMNIRVVGCSQDMVCSSCNECQARKHVLTVIDFDTEGQVPVIVAQGSGGIIYRKFEYNVEPTKSSARIERMLS